MTPWIPSLLDEWRAEWVPSTLACQIASMRIPFPTVPLVLQWLTRLHGKERKSVTCLYTDPVHVLKVYYRWMVNHFLSHFSSNIPYSFHLVCLCNKCYYYLPLTQLFSFELYNHFLFCLICLFKAVRFILTNIQSTYDTLIHSFSYVHHDVYA